MAGYSGTPLVKKIGIKPGHALVIVNAPAGFDEELVPLPPDIDRSGQRPADVAILFVANQAGLEKHLRRLNARLAPAGMLWVSWPKKASGISTDLNEGVVRAAGLAAGLVDVKICAVNEIWSGLKFVIPVKARAQRPRPLAQTVRSG